MKRQISALWQLLQEALQEFGTHDGPWLAGAVAYYAAFAIFPLLMVLLAITGYLLRLSPSAKDAQQQLLSIVARASSQALASQVAEILGGVKLQAGVGGPLGLLILLLGASGLFAALAGAFDRLWDVPPPPGIVPTVRMLLFQRLNAFLMLLALSALVIFAFVISLVLASIDRLVSGSSTAQTGWQAAQVALSVGIDTAVVAALYKVLPKPDLHWRDVWWAALLVAMVWEIGKVLLARLVIGQNYTVYGIVGAFIALMAWIYYASTLFFVGAELVRVSYRARYPAASVAPRAATAKAAQKEQNMKRAFNLLKQTVKEWSEDKAARLAAALAYYAIFSIAPLLIIIIGVAGLVFGRKAVQGQLVQQISALVGSQTAGLIQDMMRGASRPSAGIIATVVGVVLLLVGAAGVFGQLQDALNTIWEVMPRPGRSIWATVRGRALTFLMVLGIGLLLVISLLVSAVLAALNGALQGVTSGVPGIWQLVNQVVSFGVVTLLFAMMFKYLPDVQIRWRDVWIGAAFTALLFTIGKFLIGLYLGRSSVSSAYGAAGSLVVLLLWIYYSAQILFLGAEFTQVYARQAGTALQPARDAVFLTDDARVAQGIPRRSKLQAPAGAPPDPAAAPARPASQPMPSQVSLLAASSGRQDAASRRAPGLAAAVAAGMLFVAVTAARLLWRR